MNFLQPKAYFVDTDSPDEPWTVLRTQSRSRKRMLSSRAALLLFGVLIFGLILPVSMYNLMSVRGSAALLEATEAESFAGSVTFELPKSEPTAPAPELLGTVSDIAAEPAFVPAVSAPAAKSTLRINDVGIVMPIVEGEGESALYKGAWRSPWGSTPDKGGNTVLFGHRFLHLPPHQNTMFRLDEVALGDTFQIDWEGEEYTYRVSDIKIVEPSDISVLKQTHTPTVTLITCTPKFTTDQRLVVHATRL